MTMMTMIRLELVIEDRWAIGGVADAAISQPALRAADGGPQLPGSSLAGALRRHLGDVGDEWLAPLPGRLGEQEGKNPRERIRSRLRLLGALVNDGSVHSRGTTRIDGHRGAADGGSLRTEEWNDPGTVIVALEHDGSFNADLEARLSTWAPTVGRSRSTGLGRAFVEAVDRITIDLENDAQLTWWLQLRGEWFRDPRAVPLPSDAPAQRTSGLTAHRVDVPDLTFAWRTVEPLHLGADGPDAASDDRDDGRDVLKIMRFQGKPAIPGSSWKGVVRHRADMILRLLGATDDNPIISALFGSAADDGSGGRGILGFRDSILDDVSTMRRTHVAIDRFTGGARDGALFSVEAVPPGSELTLTVTAERPLPRSVTNLLDHVLRDLHDGLIGVGGMISRGYGHIALTSGRPMNLEPVEVGALLTDLGLDDNTHGEES